MSFCQASEWGMHGLQGTFPRCKKRLPSDKDERRCILECIILEHNFQTEIVRQYKRVINIHGYDRIRKYYLKPGDYKTDNEAELMEENIANDGDGDGDTFGG
jgi:hypothetical protein